MAVGASRLGIGNQTSHCTAPSALDLGICTPESAFLKQVHRPLQAHPGHQSR
jgi:hypothetical protein